MAISLRLAAINFSGPSEADTFFFDFLAMAVALLAENLIKAKFWWHQ
jgi:hypothetical protein